jgi:hypothetical protein
MASRILDQLAIAIEDPSLESSTSGVVEECDLPLPCSNSRHIKSASAPGPRRNLEAPPSLPRYTSDVSLQIDSAIQNRISDSSDKELKKKIGKYCLELKRLIDKDGTSSINDLSVQASLFSKTSAMSGASILLKCLKVCHIFPKIFASDKISLLTDCGRCRYLNCYNQHLFEGD